jgi:hypothetical protein
LELKEIIIKIQNDRILFNPRLSIEIGQTSIPFEYLRFKTNEDIYWKVEIVEYNLTEKCLKVKIIDYQISDNADFKRQKTDKDIKRLVFIGKFDFPKLHPLLMSFTIGKLNEHIINFEKVFKPVQKPSIAPIKPHVPIIREITDGFYVNFKKAHFMLGYVTFTKRIKEIDKKIDFQIFNDHILSEFENIKYWFPKKLNTKSFFVKVIVSTIDNKLDKAAATSREIDQITPDLIEGIKYLRTIALTKESKNKDLDKSLFTAEDIFSQIDSNDIEGNVFKQSEQDILKILIEKNNVRNKKELAYLSGRKQSENYPIRYTLYPNFGFLFLVEGVENNHFIWELLNSHATYIWTFEKPSDNIKLQFKRIESIINTVRASGREKYKYAYTNTGQDNDLVFKIIKHKHIGSDVVDEFPKWKDRINEQLT